MVAAGRTSEGVTLEDVIAHEVEAFSRELAPDVQNPVVVGQEVNMGRIVTALKVDPLVGPMFDARRKLYKRTARDAETQGIAEHIAGQPIVVPDELLESVHANVASLLRSFLPVQAGERKAG